MCVTICHRHPEVIGKELPKRQGAEDSDGAFASATLSSLLTYNEWNTAYYSGLNNNLLSFQLVPTNPDSTPALSGVDLLMHMSTYHKQYMEGY